MVSKFRSRSFALLLYPDDVSHAAAIDQIRKSYDYAMILHDRDFWTDDDELSDPLHIAGELKKPHYHVVLRFVQSRWNTALSDELGIAINYIQDVRRFDNALQYLIHFNDQNKAQYSIDEVQGNLKSRLQDSINNVTKSEGEKVCELIEFIKGQSGQISVTDFASFCADNGYWSEFRRSGAIFCKILDEHNSKCNISGQKE